MATNSACAVPSLHRERLMKELKEIKMNPPPLITAETVNGNLTDWIATIKGPPGTPYEDGTFKLSLHFPSSYPFEPPDVRFVTPIYHANINFPGTICTDILRDQWSPGMTVTNLLLSICCLISDCNPLDPVRPEIAALYRNNREAHDRKARDFTHKYEAEKKLFLRRS